MQQLGTLNTCKYKDFASRLHASESQLGLFLAVCLTCEMDVIVSVKWVAYQMSVLRTAYGKIPVLFILNILEGKITLVEERMNTKTNISSKLWVLGVRDHMD